MTRSLPPAGLPCMTVPQANIDSPVDLVLTALNEDAIASETRRRSWRSNADSNRSFRRSYKRASVPLSSSPHQAGVADNIDDRCKFALLTGHGSYPVFYNDRGSPGAGRQSNAKAGCADSGQLEPKSVPFWVSHAGEQFLKRTNRSG